ncbi:MAG: response regulator, partial [Planctomycetes bacterium]|nr:response regulator [Planctomycetota bacterium]
MSTQLPSVMIVDDVPLIRKGIANCLEGRGISIIATARNGQEAIELSETHCPDIVLLDIVMPILQGYEALPILRQKL